MANDKISYEATVFTTVHIDDYENGEGERIRSYHEQFTGVNLGDVLDVICETFQFKRADIEYQGDINKYHGMTELWVSQLITEDNTVATGVDIAKWKTGALELYVAHHHILVAMVVNKPIGIDQLTSLGIAVDS